MSRHHIWDMISAAKFCVKCLNKNVWGLLLCIIGSQQCLLFNLGAPGVESSNKLLLSTNWAHNSRQISAAGEYVQKLQLSICTGAYYQKRCCTAWRDISGSEDCFDTHKNISNTASFTFFSPGILFSPYAGDNMLDNLRDPSSDFFEINPISYLREETWGPCLWSSVWWDLSQNKKMNLGP